MGTFPENCIKFTDNGKLIINIISGMAFMLCFYPFFNEQNFGKEVDKNDLIYDSIHSKDFEISLIVCLAVSAPIGLDFLLDILLVTNSAQSDRFQILVLLLALILPDALIYGVVIPNNNVALLVSLFHLRNALLTLVIIRHMWEFGSNFFPLSHMLITLVFFMTGHVLDSVLAFSKNYLLVLISTKMCFFIAFAILFRLIYRWIKHILVLRPRQMADISSSDLNILVFLVPAICFGLAYVILSVITLGSLNENTSTTFLVSFTYMEAAFTVAVFLLQARFKDLNIKRAQKETEEVKRVFVRYVSHEMRTPLNTACMGLEVLASDLKKHRVSNDCYELVDEIKDSCQSGIRILDDLLDYDKLEGGIMKLDRTLITAWDLLEEAMQSIILQARSMRIFLAFKDTTIQSRMALQNIHVNVDKAKLQQAMSVILSNAIKFSPPEGCVLVGASVTRSHDCISDVLCVEVTDNGAGLSERQVAELFTTTVITTSAHSASGLGLRIAQSFIELHGGTISVSSPGIGLGCTFSVELPIWLQSARNDRDRQECQSITPTQSRSITPLLHSFRQGSESSCGPHPAPLRPRFAIDRMNSLTDKLVGASAKVASDDIRPSSRTERSEQQHSCSSTSDHAARTSESKRSTDNVSPSFSPAQPPCRVLVVDDAPMNRKLLIRLLHSIGFSVIEEAIDGYAAVEATRRARESGHPFKLITMDFQMPNMDGPTATKRIREAGFTDPIIGVTGNGMPADIEHFKAQGANQVLIKPVTRIRLEETLKAVYRKLML